MNRVQPQMNPSCRSVLILAAALALGACSTADTRIQERSAAFAQLSPAEQAAVRRGDVAPGFTPDMVYMALGKPWKTEAAAPGEERWVYRHEPLAGPNETIQGGFSRRIVYDPLRRGETLVVEPIDEKAFPHKVPSRTILTFRNGKLVGMERVRGWF